jgi:hypothetical protein
VPRTLASRELLASLDDAWAFIAEPHHLADWWPGIAAVEPDRRGVAPGARWRVHGTNRPTLFRAPNPSGTLLVLGVEPPFRFAFQLTGERLDAEIRLEDAGPRRTLATLTVEAPLLVGLKRSFAQKALGRLHALCQTAAEP